MTSVNMLYSCELLLQCFYEHFEEVKGQESINFCSEDEPKSYGFGMTCGWVIDL